VGLVWRLPLTNISVWNRIAQDVAAAEGTTLAESARLFALLNISMSDGLETSFASKYYYALWRPVTAIRRADEDGNPATAGDPAWTPLHPTTPAYPTYAGNAATLGAAASTVLASFFGSDAIPFQVHWDPYGFAGVTRSYAGFGQAAQEEANSRIYGGIHFRFDNVAGQGIGTQVADYVLGHVLLPRSHPSDGRDDGAAAGGLSAAAYLAIPETDPSTASAPSAVAVLDPTRVQTVLVSPLPGAFAGGLTPTPPGPAPLSSGTPLVTGLLGNGGQGQSAGIAGGVAMEGAPGEVVDRLWAGFDGSLSAAGGWDDLALRIPR
jgi:hypothetical protein